MCLAVLAYHVVPEYPLILVANRDEFHSRATKPLHPWAHPQSILAGKDIEGGGSWLGWHPSGRMALLTNYRDPHEQVPNPKSRGLLVTAALSGALNIQGIRESKLNPTDYHGFNLLIQEPDGALWHISNRQPSSTPTHLMAGIHGLSNHLLNTPWPKVSRAKASLTAVCKELGNRNPIEPETLAESLINFMRDREVPPDHLLPDTGVGLAWERKLSPIFICLPEYGTRSTTALICDRQGHVYVREQTWSASGEALGTVTLNGNRSS